MRMEHEGTDGNFIPLWDALDFTVKSLLFESWLDYEISLVLSGSFFIQSVGNKKILCALPFPQFISINVGFRISFLSLKVATGGIKRIIWVRSSLLAYFPGRVNELTPVSVTYKDQYSKYRNFTIFRKTPRNCHFGCFDPILQFPPCKHIDQKFRQIPIGIWIYVFGREISQNIAEWFFRQWIDHQPSHWNRQLGILVYYDPPRENSESMTFHILKGRMNVGNHKCRQKIAK